MFRNTNLKAGEALLREKPFIYVLSSKYRSEYCDYCFAKGQLLKCSNCLYVYYCGKACQREGWTAHKAECSDLKKIAPRIIPDAVRLMGRIIRKMNKGGEAVRSYYTLDRYRMFKDLMSHYTDLKLDEPRLEHFTSLCAVLFDFLGADVSIPNSAELIGIYGRMVINSFNICDAELKSLGVGLYLAASILDHSCKPNAVATFEGTTLFVRTIVDIKTLDWAKVFISYIDILNTPQDRQDELEKQYYFLCRCSKCLDKSKVNLMYGAACQRKDCDGCINLHTYSDGFRCLKCYTVPEQRFVDDYKEVMTYSKESLEKMKNLAYYDLCKVCLKHQENILYKLHILRIKMFDLTFESCIDFEYWDEAKSVGLKLIEGYLFYYDDFNPLVGLLYLKLAKITALLNEQSMAVDFVKKAFDILKITHGVNSTIFKTEIRPLMEQLRSEMGKNSY